MVSRFYSFYEQPIAVPVISQCGDILEVTIYCKNAFVGMVKGGEVTKMCRSGKKTYNLKMSFFTF